jgi:hypothetical protein
MSDSGEPRVYTIDRFEGHLAVLEGADGRAIDVDRSTLPPRAREGDIVQAVRHSGCGVHFVILDDATAAVREQVRKEIDRLAKDDPGGDIAL